MRKALYLSFLISFSQFVYAQCVTSFPHKEDFENSTLLQASSSCDNSIAGDVASKWTQDPNDDGNWRADSAGTPSTGTGPGSTPTTTGNGTGKDYNPGTTSGIYYYTESSSATGCANKEINLISPCYDFSGSNFYRLKFAYHMLGGTMGVLHVDVFDSLQWVNDVYLLKGSQGASWKTAEVPLFNYNKKEIKIRLRMIMGNSFTSDCAIDDLVVESYTPVDYDAVLNQTYVTPENYYFFPIQHADSFSIGSFCRNIGRNNISNARLVASGTNWSDSSASATLQSLKNDSFYVTSKFFPQDKNDTTLRIDMKIAETDADLSNNSKSFQIHITDSVLARDNGVPTGFVGFNTGVGGLGNMFDIKVKDTLTTVSFQISVGVVGDSFKINLYEFGTTPGAFIASTNHVLSNGVQGTWFTTKFSCPQILKKGKYFLSVEQLSSGNNMNLGYSAPFFKPKVTYYRVGATWTPIEDANIIGVALIHLNFGESKPKALISSQDTVCANEFLTITGSGGSNYSWSPSGLFNNPFARVARISNLSQDTTIRLAIETKCGAKDTVYKRIIVKSTPSATFTPDTTICKNESVRLSVSTSPTNTILWSDGSQSTSINVAPSSSNSYKVDIDSSNGCSISHTIQVNVSIPTLSITPDTTVCEASKLILSAMGAPTIEWIGGSSSTTYIIYPTMSSTYKAIGTLANGCKDTIEVMVTVKPGPNLSTSNDTSVCFGQKLTLKAFGTDSYKWTNGPSTSSWFFRPLKSKYYYVVGQETGGCSIIDSVYVMVSRNPSLSISNDTTICEGTKATLKANTSVDGVLKWSTNENTPSINVEPIKETTYNVSSTNTTGCKSEDSVKVSINPLPIAIVSSSINNKQITLSSKSKHTNTHAWVFGDGNSGTGESINHTYSDDGDYTIKYTATNTCGNDDTTFVLKIKTVSIESFANGTIKVYPNPSSNLWNIVIESNGIGTANMALYSSNGTQVFNKSLAKKTRNLTYSINSKELAAGLYLLQCQLGEERVALYLIKN